MPETTGDSILDLMLECGRALDESPKFPPREWRPAANLPPADAASRPGSDFNRRGDWSELLTRGGWRLDHERGDVSYWTRPGKKAGVSASLGHCKTADGLPRLRVFSTSARPFETDTSYDLFGAYALLKHNGDVSAAARELAGKGYGEQNPEPIRMTGGRIDPNKTTAVIDFGRPASAGARPQPRDKDVWGHGELMAHAFPPGQWLVDGLIADESLTILGGAQKVGKSWLALQLAQCVASGTEFLGRKVSAGQVVYLALEDGPRRLQDRLTKQGARGKELAIRYHTRFPKLDTRPGVDAIAEIFNERPRLLIIDTLAAAKSGGASEGDPEQMAELFNALRDATQDYGVPSVVVAHHGKRPSGDPAHDIRGSSAIGAAADVMLGLYKVRRDESGEAIDAGDGMKDPSREGAPDFWLKARGRDLADVSVAVVFGVGEDWRWRENDYGTWDPNRIRMSDANDWLRKALGREARWMTIKEIETATGKSRKTVEERLKKMAGELEEERSGRATRYRLADGGAVAA